MKPLTEEQRQQVEDYLSRTNKACKNGHSKDWDIGEIDYFAADLIMGDSSKQQPSPGPFVKVRCKKCNETDTVDCEDAGISDC